MDELVGRTLGRYRLEVAMRAGYSGQVFRAKDTESNRDVALKVFKPNPLQERIKEGLQPLLGLKHANIIEILEVAETGGQLYLVSEFVPGGSVSTLLSRYAQSNKQLELPLALSLMRQAADALSYAHNKGVIHGDVKPDNMLLSAPVSTQQLSRAYTLKLGDFLMTRLTSDTAMTQDELVVSSPAYMSPEQCQGLSSDARTDLYSFGIVLYEVMTGLLPFEVKNIGEAAIKHLYAAPRSPRELRPDLSVELEALILRLLSKNPADRYAQASEVRDALQGMLERIEPQGPPPTLIRGALEPQPTQPNIPDLPDTSDSARVTIADSFGRIVKVLPLTSAGIRVGRLEFNEARLEDDNVSRQHMRVDWNGEQAYITDWAAATARSWRINGFCRTRRRTGRSGVWSTSGRTGCDWNHQKPSRGWRWGWRSIRRARNWCCRLVGGRGCGSPWPTSDGSWITSISRFRACRKAGCVVPPRRCNSTPVCRQR
ncbi:MAG: protein kinase [Pleurocapsa sp. SU_196_0]|nr:protein kinase [Pleurocapsa sp. SU_196_0]